MVSLSTKFQRELNSVPPSPNSSSPKNTSIIYRFEQHQGWDGKNSCQSYINNLRLMLQPLISFNWLKNWLRVFPIPQLLAGLARLKALMNFYPNAFAHWLTESQFSFSSA
jgi:hypothetical protein